jgi:phosphoserine aminotransferase
MKPLVRPKNPRFSSGPCAKRPGWSLAALEGALLGRSHRAKPGRAKIDEVVNRSRALLGIPADYRVAIVPGSDTGAIEMAMWSLLGERGVDVLAWESFGEGWATDIAKQLKLADLRLMRAPYGSLPDLSQVDTDRDVVFTWNGTTSGACIPHGDWIKADRQGLTLCDATSAAFAMDLPWEKLDVVTWSWQKALGGEAAHGMLVLSPRAVARLEGYTPPWPLPKVFRLTSKGKFAEGIFKGETINTPSLLAIEDAIDGLAWAEGVGGRKALVARAKSNLETIARWVERTPWIDFLVQDPASRSWTSVCLKLVDDWFQRLSPEAQRAAVKQLEALVDAEGAGYDIAGHRDAPPGLRIWCGSTVERSDVEALLPWLDWAYGEVRRAAAA